MPWVLFFNLRTWFILIYLSTSAGFSEFPRQKRRRRVSGQTPYDLAKDKGQSQVMGLLRPASWQPFWSHDEDQPTIMDHVSHITSLTHDVIKDSGYYGSWTINRHEKTLPIKSIWKFVSFISAKHEDETIKHGYLRYCRTTVNPFHCHIYPTISQLPLRSFKNFLGVVCWWSKDGIFSHNHFNPETFWFLGRPVDARYDIAPMDQWHSVIPWVNECRLSAAVSRSIFSWTQDPALFATLWRFGTRSIFTSNRMCQQHRCQCLGFGAWDRLDGNFKAQSVTNSNKIIQPSWSFSIFQFSNILISQHILTIF